MTFFLGIVLVFVGSLGLTLLTANPDAACYRVAVALSRVRRWRVRRANRRKRRERLFGRMAGDGSYGAPWGGGVA
jgi:hypothetical protein